MSMPTLVIVAVLAFWMLGAYTRLKRLRHAAHTAYGPLAAHLRQRHAVALALAEASRSMLEPDHHAMADQVIDAAQQAGRATDAAQIRGMRGNALQDVGSAEEQLGTLLDDLIEELQHVTSGVGPEPAVSELLRQRDSLQEHIHGTRLVYNNAARDYNQALHIFPTTLVAGLFQFKDAPLLSGNATLRLRGAPTPSAPMPLI